jgi:hypothetical protein
MTHEARISGRTTAQAIDRRRELQKHQLLRADPDSVAAAQGSGARDDLPAQLDAVSRAQIFDAGLLARNPDARMLAGDQRVIERDLAIGAAPNERVPLW